MRPVEANAVDGARTLLDKVWDEHVVVQYDLRRGAYYFEVTSSEDTRGIFNMPRTWTFTDAEVVSEP